VPLLPQLTFILLCLLHNEVLFFIGNSIRDLQVGLQLVVSVEALGRKVKLLHMLGPLECLAISNRHVLAEGSKVILVGLRIR